jgi:hypothetical protein
MRHAFLSVGAAVAAVACAFPDVTYSNDSAAVDGSPMRETSVGDDSATSSDGDGAPASEGDATMDVAGSDTSSGADTLPPADAVDDYVFEAAADATACDQDEDGYQAIGPVCGGGDCDDQDKRAYPGEPNYLTALPRVTTMYGDWNCNHVVEKQYSTNVNCRTAILTCDNTSGFTGDPPCGTYGTFVQCMTMNLGLCDVAATSMQLQACK